MFTGIIERSLPLLSSTKGPSFPRLTLPNPWQDVKPGDSISPNGVCLTVAEMLHNTLGFDAIPETLSRTNLGLLQPQDRIHVERALLAGSRMDGHFLQGPVAPPAPLLETITTNNEFRLRLESPPEFASTSSP